MGWLALAMLWTLMVLNVDLYWIRADLREPFQADALLWREGN